MELSVSFLSIKENLKKNIDKLDNCNIDYIHVDVMDGKFVKNKTLGYDEFKLILKDTTKKKAVHLMVNNIKEYVDAFSNLNPEYITFHIEVEDNINNLIEYIHKKGSKVGIALCPDTPVSYVYEYLNKIDLVLIMSVVPGQGGQTFKPIAISKIDELAKYREKNHLQFKIEVDGGINDYTIKKCNTDISVIGSYITSSNNYEERINSLKS